MSDRRKSGFTIIEMLVVIAIIGILAALLLPSVQAAREAGRRIGCTSNQRQLGQAVMAYASAKTHLPPAKTTRPTRTWIIYTLPYLEERNLHDDFDNNREWNSAGLQQAMNIQLGFLLCPSTPGKGRIDNIGGGRTQAVSDYATPTSYSAVLDQGGFGPRSRNRAGALQVNNTRLTLSDIKDGAAQTILLTEDAGRPEHWTRNGRGPRNSNPGGGNLGVRNGRVLGAGFNDPNATMPLHGATRNGLRMTGPCPVNCSNNNEPFSFHPQAIVVTFVDGHVKVIKQSISIRVFASLITRNGGETLDSNLYD